MKPTILMFCPQFRPLIGGAERQAEKLALTLAALDCQVTILTPRLEPDSPDKEILHGVFIERFSITDLSSRFSFRGIALLNIPYILWQIMWAVLLRLKGVDVLHCHIASLQTAGAALAGRLCKVPVLLKAATADDRSDLGKIENAGSSGRLVAWLVRVLIQTWVATTVAVEEALIRAGIATEKIVRIPNGVTLTNAHIHPIAVSGVKHFLYLGRISKNSGRDLPTLINAFDRLAETYPDVELAIVGEGDLLEQTRQLVKLCSARNRIQLPGFGVSETWLNWADCLVLPSRREGLSNTLLEAMSAGVVCIANDIPPNREVLDDGRAGILVPIGDIKTLVSVMRELIENQAEYTQYQNYAKIRIKDHYSITSVAERYVDLYNKLIIKHN